MPSEQAEAVFATLRTNTVARYRWIQCVNCVDRGMKLREIFKDIDFYVFCIGAWAGGIGAVAAICLIQWIMG